MFLLASLKTDTNSKVCSESRLRISALAFLRGSIFSRTFFRVIGGYLKAGTNFLKSVPGGFSELITDFKGASRYFIFNFLHKKDQRSYIKD
jgi:hypothetical protein